MGTDVMQSSPESYLLLRQAVSPSLHLRQGLIREQGRGASMLMPSQTCRRLHLRPRIYRERCYFWCNMCLWLKTGRYASLPIQTEMEKHNLWVEYMLTPF